MHQDPGNNETGGDRESTGTQRTPTQRNTLDSHELVDRRPPTLQPRENRYAPSSPPQSQSQVGREVPNDSTISNVTTNLTQTNQRDIPNSASATASNEMPLRNTRGVSANME
ncbi:hypothetical protein Pcinc_032198 [Petrolisthes cinctipes]|uniref:Uncharacterized protein n=1 Tax=Petrolisthes cinctipes TaxID=88211 RepID=A0AAE1EUV7_PETCI|nr:hypothetical protein Pcinc_032198 [Petrolisthes cinctipes]